jgi:hypothetical protein
MTTVLTPPVANSVDGKVTNLAAFILANLPAESRNDATAPVRAVTMLARSPESPIAQAVLRLGSELAERRIRVRAIFACLDAPAGAAVWTSGQSTVPFGREVRWARNPRFIDAHEQLVLHGAACWLGDCMRRDPTKRDSLDQSKAKCITSAGFATTSFERLWNVSEPVALRMPHLHREEIASSLASASVAATAAATSDLDESAIKS